MICFLSFFFSFQCYITCKAYLQQASDSPQSGQQPSHKCESQPGHRRTLAHDQSAAQQAQASLWHQPSNQGESLWYLWGICDSAGLPEGKTPTQVFIVSSWMSRTICLSKFLTNKTDILKWYVEGHFGDYYSLDFIWICKSQLQYLHLDTAVFLNSDMSVFMTSCPKITIKFWADLQTLGHIHIMYSVITTT